MSVTRAPAAERLRPMLPDYAGACLSGLVPGLLAQPGEDRPGWLPEAARTARQVVLLVVDGLGWEQLTGRWGLAPTLASMEGRAISSVVPTTTATALTSITTGLPPSEHGVVGYRVRVLGDQVMNVLRWRAGGQDMRASVLPAQFQTASAFAGSGAPAVIRAEFSTGGFTAAHLVGSSIRGWRVPSSLVVEIGRAVRAGAPFVYAYYDGVDKVAHEWGLGEHYEAELGFTDRLVAQILSGLSPGAALVVTADHGQVAVGEAVVKMAEEILDDVTLLSGEGRFRWLHVRPGTQDRVAALARERYGDIAWVRTRDEAVGEGWFGGPLRPDVAARLGDVALVARAPVAFGDPADAGHLTMVTRHGSMTAAEMLVPLLACRR